MISTSSLADSLELVTPWLDRELVSPAALERIRMAARQLPPVHRAGFECRLDASASDVDLQQGISAALGEPASLLAFLDRMDGEGQHHPGWSSARRIAQLWQDPRSPLAPEIRELWIEVDLPAFYQNVSGLAPSLFVRFGPKMSLDSSLERTHQVISLLSEQSETVPTLEAITACGRALPPGAWISHLGAMLGRESAGLRLHISGLRLENLAGFLRQAGWPGDPTRVSPLAAELLEIVDGITYCLDIGSSIGSKLGLECSFLGTSLPEPRLPQLLDSFVAKGICAPAKREALLAWPGRLLPCETADPWPDELIVVGLLEPAERLGFLHRRWSHVKLTWLPNAPLEAKAYFGYQHAWLEPAIRPEAVSLGSISQASAAPFARPQWSASHPKRDPISMSLQRAIAFLIEARNREGWWYDYAECRNGSDEYATCFVGAALARLSDPEARKAAEIACGMLARRSARHGWGWNAEHPADSDSTSWGLRLSAAVGTMPPERVARASAALEEHLLPAGGYASYLRTALTTASSGPDEPGEKSIDGWCSTPHCCLTAVAASLPDERPRQFLRETQRPDGSWQGYWWADPAYTAAHAAEALARTGRPDDRARVELAVEWSLGRLQPEGPAYPSEHELSREPSPFATAACVRVLASAPELKEIGGPLRRAVAWLLRVQHTSGVWSPSALMRMPRPDVIDPDENPLAHDTYLDKAGLITTAMVVSALDSVRTALGEIELI